MSRTTRNTADKGYDVAVSTPYMPALEKVPEWSENNLPILFDRYIQKELSDIQTIVS